MNDAFHTVERRNCFQFRKMGRLTAGSNLLFRNIEELPKELCPIPLDPRRTTNNDVISDATQNTFSIEVPAAVHLIAMPNELQLIGCGDVTAYSGTRVVMSQ